MSIALKALTSNGVVRPHIEGDQISIIETLVVTGEYKTGGDESLKKLIESILSQTGAGIIKWLQVSGIPGFIFIYNYETGKLQVFDSGKEGAVLKELAEAEYPAAIREGQPRVFAIGV